MNMLGKLFGSNARVKILKTFLHNPDKRFYIRQLARDLSLQVNSVRRELENLEKFGLLTSTEMAEDQTGMVLEKNKKLKKEKEVYSNKKYYYTNRDFILYEEIKALMAKAQVLYEKDFLKKLKKIGSPKLLILTGFFVNQESVVDIFVVGRLNKNKFLSIIGELEKELDRELNYTLMETKEFKYRRDITDVFLYDILESKKVVIIDEIGLS